MPDDPRPLGDGLDEGLLSELLEATTPGPWEVSIVRPGAPIDLAGSVILATVCSGWQGDRTIHVTCADDERMATPHPRLNDAELIALAPTLARALLRLTSTPTSNASPEALRKIRACVDEQAEDEGLWFVAKTAPEAYLQQELRRLHAVIESEPSNASGEGEP